MAGVGVGHLLFPQVGPQNDALPRQLQDTLERSLVGDSFPCLVLLSSTVVDHGISITNLMTDHQTIANSYSENKENFKTVESRLVSIEKKISLILKWKEELERKEKEAAKLASLRAKNQMEPLNLTNRHQHGGGSLHSMAAVSRSLDTGYPVWYAPGIPVTASKKQTATSTTSALSKSLLSSIPASTTATIREQPLVPPSSNRQQHSRTDSEYTSGGVSRLHSNFPHGSSKASSKQDSILSNLNLPRDITIVPLTEQVPASVHTSTSGSNCPPSNSRIRDHFSHQTTTSSSLPLHGFNPPVSQAMGGVLPFMNIPGGIPLSFLQSFHSSMTSHSSAIPSQSLPSSNQMKSHQPPYHAKKKVKKHSPVADRRLAESLNPKPSSSGLQVLPHFPPNFSPAASQGNQTQEGSTEVVNQHSTFETHRTTSQQQQQQHSVDGVVTRVPSETESPVLSNPVPAPKTVVKKSKNLDSLLKRITAINQNKQDPKPAQSIPVDQLASANKQQGSVRRKSSKPDQLNVERNAAPEVEEEVRPYQSSIGESDISNSVILDTPEITIKMEHSVAVENSDISPNSTESSVDLSIVKVESVRPEGSTNQSKGSTALKFSVENLLETRPSSGESVELIGQQITKREFAGSVAEALNQPSGTQTEIREADIHQPVGDQILRDDGVPVANEEEGTSANQPDLANESMEFVVEGGEEGERKVFDNGNEEGSVIDDSSSLNTEELSSSRGTPCLVKEEMIDVPVEDQPENLGDIGEPQPQQASDCHQEVGSATVLTVPVLQLPLRKKQRVAKTKTLVETSVDSSEVEGESTEQHKKKSKKGHRNKVKETDGTSTAEPTQELARTEEYTAYQPSPDSSNSVTAKKPITLVIRKSSIESSGYTLAASTSTPVKRKGLTPGKSQQKKGKSDTATIKEISNLPMGLDKASTSKSQDFNAFAYSEENIPSSLSPFCSRIKSAGLRRSSRGSATPNKNDSPTPKKESQTKKKQSMIKKKDSLVTPASVEEKRSLLGRKPTAKVSASFTKEAYLRMLSLKPKGAATNPAKKAKRPYAKLRNKTALGLVSLTGGKVGSIGKNRRKKSSISASCSRLGIKLQLPLTAQLKYAMGSESSEPRGSRTVTAAPTDLPPPAPESPSINATSDAATNLPQESSRNVDELALNILEKENTEPLLTDSAAACNESELAIPCSSRDVTGVVENRTETDNSDTVAELNVDKEGSEMGSEGLESLFKDEDSILSSEDISTRRNLAKNISADDLTDSMSFPDDEQASFALEVDRLVHSPSLNENEDDPSELNNNRGATSREDSISFRQSIKTQLATKVNLTKREPSVIANNQQTPPIATKVFCNILSGIKRKVVLGGIGDKQVQRSGVDVASMKRKLAFAIKAKTPEKAESEEKLKLPVQGVTEANELKT